MRLKPSFEGADAPRSRPTGRSGEGCKHAGARRSGTSPRWEAQRAFTMVEIALALAIIGFALVAIIGVLPDGLTVQQQNRERTLVNQEALLWIDTLRGDRPDRSSLSNAIWANTLPTSDDLPRYVIAITNYAQDYTAVDGGPVGTAYQLGYTATTPFPITNSALIVGLLTTPKWWTNQNGTWRSNYPVAYVRALSGQATEKPPQTNEVTLDLAFSYRMAVEVLDRWLTDPDAATGSNAVARSLGQNLRDVRLIFRWPLRPNGTLGNGFETYRTVIGGGLDWLPGGPNPATRPELFYFRNRQYAPVALQP